MRHREQVEVRRDPAEAFAYLADFSRASGWDPGVFRLAEPFLGRTVERTDDDALAGLESRLGGAA